MTLSRSQQFIIAAVLAVLMIVTRGHHFASVDALPSASWAIFFLLGLYLSSAAWMPIFLILAAALDVSAVLWGGVTNSACLSPAYGFLVPAYGSLWLAGRWYASHYQFKLQTLLPLIASVVVGTATSAVFSGGGYYFFSGNYIDPTVAEYSQRFVNSFTSHLSVMAFYLVLAMIAHIVFRAAQLSQRANQQH